MDAENQIDNNSLMDSLLDGNDDSAIGGDAVPSSTSDGVNKSSKRMQYFGAVFNLANTVRNSFFHSLAHFFYLRRSYRNRRWALVFLRCLMHLNNLDLLWVS